MKKVLFGIAVMAMVLASPGVVNATGEASPQVILQEAANLCSLSVESLSEGYQDGSVEIIYYQDHYEVVVETEGGTMVIEILDSF